MTHSSTSIEGNVLREDQVEAVSRGKQVRAEEDQIIEVRNYLKALELVNDLAKNDGFGRREVLNLHKLVMANLMIEGKVGKLREKPVYVVNILPDGKEDLVYTALEPKLVSNLVDNLISWLKKASDLHLVIRAGLLHLYQWGWGFRKVLVLEDYYNKNREEYFSKLQTGRNFKSRQKVDLTEWLEYYIEGFLMEVLRVEREVLTLKFVGKKGLTEGYLSEDEMVMVDFTVSLGRITSKDVVDILKIPKRTAQSKLRLLVNKKVLQKKSSGPATYYVLKV